MSAIVTSCLVVGLAQAASASVSGVVVDAATRAPVAGAQVTVVPAGGSPSSAPARPLTAITGEDGRYVLRGLAPGPHRLTAHNETFVSGAEGSWLRVMLHAGASHEAEPLELQKGGVLAGRVMHPSGEPLVGVRVEAVHILPPSHGAAARLVPGGRSASTDDRGAFRIWGLAPGDYYVQARPWPPRPDVVTTATILVTTYYPAARMVDDALPIRVEAGAAHEGLDVQMGREPAYTVAGRIVDAQGRPVSNALVKLMSAADGVPAAMATVAEGRTDASGHFALSGITSGRYTVLASPPVVTSRAQSPAAAPPRGPGIQPGVVGSVLSDPEIRTEIVNGTATQFRDDLATRLPLAVDGADIADLHIVVSTPRQAP